MKALSEDLRLRIVRAVQDGKSKAEVARVFQVSLSSVKRFVQLSQQSASLAYRRPTGRKLHISPLAYDALIQQLKSQPDATLAQHAQLWLESHQQSLSLPTLSRAIARVGWTRKKRHLVPVNATRPPGKSSKSS